MPFYLLDLEFLLKASQSSSLVEFGRYKRGFSDSDVAVSPLGMAACMSKQ